MIARGRVTKAGRTLSVCAGDVFALNNGKEKLIATMLSTRLSTSMAIREQGDATG